MGVDYEHFFSVEQIAKWKREGHWPPTAGIILNPISNTARKVVENGEKLAQFSRENHDALGVSIGLTMQEHPKSWPAVLLSGVVKPEFKPMLERIIQKSESE